MSGLKCIGNSGWDAPSGIPASTNGRPECVSGTKWGVDVPRERPVGRFRVSSSGSRGAKERGRGVRRAEYPPSR